MKKRIGIICLLFLLSILLLSAACAGDDDDDDSIGPPQIQTLELIAGGAPGYYGTAVGLLPDGRTVVAATKGRALLYYEIDDETVTPVVVADYASAPDLAVDANGAAHLVYHNFGTGMIDYATNAGGDWTSEAIAEVSDWETHPVIALGENGQPRIAFNCQEKNSHDNAIVFIARQGAEWKSEVLIEAQHELQPYVWLTLDDNGDAYVSYIHWNRLYVADNTGGAWVVEEVCSVSGYWQALAVDHDGVRHLLYHEWEETGDSDDDGENPYGISKLIYGNDAGGDWTFETIDAAENEGVGPYVQLLVDDANALHLATIHYQMYAENPLYLAEKAVYARRIDGAWQFEEFEHSDLAPVQLSLAVNSAGEATIAAHDALLFGLYLFNNATGDWRARLIDEDSDAGAELSLALDNQNHPAASYYNQGKQAIQLTRFDGEDWHTETVSDDYPPSRLVFDHQGVPHVFYLHDSNVVHAWENESHWQTETAVSGYRLYDKLSVAIDADNAIHLLSQNKDEDYDYSFNYTTNASGEWLSSVIDDENNLCHEHCLAVDGNGHAHAAFFQEDTNSLMYATNATGEWKTRTIDSPGKNSGPCSIAVDSANRLHLSYANENDYVGDSSAEHGLRYATNASGEWQTELVDNPDDHPVGLYSSLVLDRRDRPIIAYSYHGSNYWDGYDLRVAWKADGIWQTKILDRPGEAGLYISLVGDANDLFHVAYYGAGGLYYLSFTMNSL